MKNNKNGLDEMQKQHRNSIGNQMFMLMFYAILLNIGLHGAGITWLPYPVDVMVIITACMGIYLVRLIASNAYLPAKAQNRKGIIILITAIIFSIVLGMSVVLLFKQSPIEVIENTGDDSALILMIVSAIGLISTSVTAVIKKVNNKDNRDD